jgi:hypothetical protein
MVNKLYTALTFSLALLVCHVTSRLGLAEGEVYDEDTFNRKFYFVHLYPRMFKLHSMVFFAIALIKTKCSLAEITFNLVLLVHRQNFLEFFSSGNVTVVL